MRDGPKGKTMYFLIDLDNLKVIGKSDATGQALEDYAQDEVTENYDIISSVVGFSKAYPAGELTTLYINLTGEVDGIDFDFAESSRRTIADTVLSVIVNSSNIPIIDEDGGLPMATNSRKKAAVKKASAAKKTSTEVTTTAAKSGGTRSSTSGTQKVKRGEKPKNDTSVMGAIWSYCSKQITIDDICEDMVTAGYTPPRRSEPADASYLKGYISAMIREGKLAKV